MEKFISLLNNDGMKVLIFKQRFFRKNQFLNVQNRHPLAPILSTGFTTKG